MFFTAALKVGATAAAFAPYPSRTAFQRFTQDQFSFTLISVEAAPRDLSHELGHILALQFHQGDKKPYFFFPTRPIDIQSDDLREAVDFQVNVQRRLAKDTIEKARQNPHIFHP